MAGGCRRGRHLLPGKSERGRTTVWLCTATFMYIYAALLQFTCRVPSCTPPTPPGKRGLLPAGCCDLWAPLDVITHRIARVLDSRDGREEDGR